MGHWTLAAIIAFVLVQLGIGVFVSRRVRGESDYILGGRRLGTMAAGFSLFATWFAAESLLGASAAIRDQGLSGGRADPMGYALALILMGLFLAARLRRTGAVTLPQALRERFGSRVERLAAALMIPTTTLYAAAQIRGFGQVLAAFSPLELQAGIVVATGVVIAYTTLGGLLGDVYTDLLQGGIVLVGVLVLLGVLVAHLGGPLEALHSIRPEQLLLVPAGEPLLGRIDTWLVPVIGALVVQESVSRVLACRDARVARRAALLGGGLYAVFGLVPVLIGLLGAHAGIEAQGEDFVPALALALLPGALSVIFIGALVAAILSTVDSSLLAIGAVVSSDLSPMLAPGLDDRGRLRVARVATALTGVAACLLALCADSIYGIVLMADGLGTAGLAVVCGAAMWSRFGGPRAALAALSGAFVTAWVLGSFTRFEAPFLASLGVALMLFLGVGAFEGPRPSVPEDPGLVDRPRDRRARAASPR
jgi:Na+/proline symporter